MREIALIPDASERIRALSRYAQWGGRYLYARAMWRRRSRTGSVLLGRYACLGADVMRCLQPSRPVVNVQKGRVDYMTDCWRDRQSRARTLRVVGHMKREEILGCILQQELLFDWGAPERPVGLLMDSMAELGDQRFFSKSNDWSFLSSYSDLAHSKVFEASFGSDRLLAADKLEGSFDLFFEQFRQRFGDVPIFYLHFPTRLEQRQKFVDQHWAIREALDRIRPRFESLYSISVDEKIVCRDGDAEKGMEDFPYHYNRETYQAFADIIRATGAWSVG
jgi:hypothetical protein